MNNQSVNINFVGLTFEQLTKAWCVYELWNGQDLIFVGVTKLTRISEMTDAMERREVMQIVRNDTVLSIAVKFVGDRTACQNQRGLMFRAAGSMPPGNRSTMVSAPQMIRCNEDGMTYRTQTEAAQAYKLSQSALSNHLRGLPGFVRVKGRTFSRV